MQIPRKFRIKDFVCHPRDIRPALEHVVIGEAGVVATNGHTALLLGEMPDSYLSCLVHNKEVAQALTVARARKEDLDPTTLEPVDHPPDYPPLDRVATMFAPSEDAVVVSLDARYVKRAAEAILATGHSRLTMHVGGSLDPVIVHGAVNKGDEPACTVKIIVMPCRIE